ncbi:MAG: Tn3 family transposase [Acidobacteria bacterium]|nr:Tn3 family transposase [Acidobacteriota bacterium]
MPRHILLSDGRRHAIETAHFDLDQRDIARYWTLSANELLGIQRRRRDANRFGFAVQLCLLRFPGWPAKKDSPVPVSLLRYVGEQLGIESADIEDYFRRQPTRSDHLQEIIDLYGFRSFTVEVRVELEAWMKSQVHRWNTPVGMLMALLDQMRLRHIVIPALSTVEDLAWRTHRRVELEALAKLATGLTPTQRAEIETLLIPAAGDDDRTLTWLRRPLGTPGVAGMLDLLDRLDFVRSYEIHPQLATDISPLLVRQFASRGARHTLQHLRDYETDKRLGLAASFLLDFQPTLLDQIVDLFTHLVGYWFNRAEKRHWRSFQEHGRTINEKLHHFLQLGGALVDARKKRADLEAAVESALGWDSLSSSLGETKLVAAPLDFSTLEELPAQHSRARQYAPRLLAALNFQAIAALQPLLKTVEVLRSLNKAHQSAIPADAPRGFVPPRWRPYVFAADGKIDRAYYELCVLNELNLAPRSGDVWIAGSRRFLPLDDYLLPVSEWKKLSGGAGQLSCASYLEQRRQQVHYGLERMLPLLAEGQLPDVVLKVGKLSISPLEADLPADAEAWSNRLYDVLPRMQITDLLSEVDSWTGFSQHFRHLYKQEPAEDRAMVLAVILADATNLGLTKIAEAMPDRSDRQLSWVADWYVREENYAKALADLIEKQYQIPLAAQWGTGTTSSSDGQAFPIGARSRSWRTSTPSIGAIRWS